MTRVLHGAGLRDPALPHLDAGLDAATVSAALAPAWSAYFHTPIDITGGTVTYVRYKPSTSLIVGYRLSASGAGAQPVILGYGKMVPADRAADALDRARASADRKSDTHVLWLESLSMIFHVFPFDREVHGLRHLMNRNKMKRIARAAISWESPAIRVSGKRTSLSLRRYKPERRVVVAADLGCVDETTGVVTRLRSHVKAYADDTGARVARITAHVRASCPPGVIVPAVLGYDADTRVLFQAEVDGRPLIENTEEAAWAHTGRALAWLHSLPPSDAGPPTHTIEAALADARSLVEYVRHLDDAVLGSTIERVVGALEQYVPAPIAATTVHGDFHHHQVLVAGDRVALVDWDSAGDGDARLDVGTFLAHATLARLSDAAHTAHLSRATAAYLAAYRSQAGRDIPSLGWFTALGLARLAAVPFREVRPAWRSDSGRILAAALEALG